MTSTTNLAIRNSYSSVQGKMETQVLELKTCGTLGLLPLEVIFNILSYLSPYAIPKNIALVNRVFRIISLDVGLWRIFSRVYCPEMLVPEVDAPQAVLLGLGLRKVAHTLALQQVSKNVPSVSLTTLNEWRVKYSCTTSLRVMNTERNHREIILARHQQSWPFLRKFKLSSEYGFFGIYDIDFVNFFEFHSGIEKLVLREVVRVSEASLMQALGFCKKLVELEVHHDYLTDDFLVFLSKNFKLTSLKLSGVDRYTEKGISTLSKGFKELIHFEIHMFDDTKKRPLNWISFLSSHPRLESFTLSPADPSDVDDDLIHAACLLPTIKKLELFECERVTLNGLRSLLYRESKCLEKISMIHCSEEVKNAIENDDSFTPLLDKLCIVQKSPKAQ